MNIIYKYIHLVLAVPCEDDNYNRVFNRRTIMESPTQSWDLLQYFSELEKAIYKTKDINRHIEHLSTHTACPEKSMVMPRATQKLWNKENARNVMGMMRIQMHAYITLLVSCIIPRFRIIWQLLTPGHFEETKSMESNLWENGWSFFFTSEI